MIERLINFIKRLFGKQVDDFTGEEFLVSDTHFYDQKMIKLKGRKYQNGQEMTEDMIKIWNKRITGNDDVIFLGDFSRMKYLEETVGIPNALEVLKRLCWNKLTFIPGNHDLPEFLVLAKKTNKGFVYKESLKGTITVKDRVIDVLFVHRPEDALRTQLIRPTIVFHGHCHGKRTLCKLESTHPSIFVDVSWDVMKEPKKLKFLVNKYLKELK